MAVKKPATPKMDDLVLEARTRYTEGESADSDNRKDMADDLRFTFEPGYQWDAVSKAKRIGRPCYSFNRVIGAVNQAIGEQRQVTPSGKVRAVSKDAAVETANVFGGLIRNIESCSRAEDIYDNQFKYAVAGGYGAWRVLPYYCDDKSFDQDLRIEEIANPFTAVWDPNATDPCKRDAWWAFVAERISKDEYQFRFPGFRPTSFQTTRDGKGWIGDKDVRIAEFYKKNVKLKTIALLTDGRVVAYDAATKRVIEDLGSFGSDRQAPKVERTRKVEVYSVTWSKTDGANLLEGPIDYEWRFVPVVRLPGRYVNIEGKQIVQSLIRHSKDPQKTYNYHRSTMVETAAMTPKSPYLVTSKMITGFEEEWKSANAVNRPYLKYNLDPAAVASGGMPKREQPPDVPQALILLAQQDAEDIRQTTGYQNPASDQQVTQGNESGVALGKRMAAMESGAYEFLSNLGKAIQFTWDLCIDMIPSVIDTDRIVRTLGEDQVEAFMRVNSKEANKPGDPIVMLKEGTYGVTVTLGPSFATARLESMATLLDAAEKVPAIGEAAPDLIAKNLDVRDAAELHKRVRQQMIQQGKIQPNEQDMKDMPPPAPPDPVQQGLADRLAAQAAKDQATAQKTQAETVAAAIKAHGAPLELQQLIDELVGQRLENMIAAQQLGIGPGGVMTMQRKAEADSGVG